MKIQDQFWKDWEVEIVDENGVALPEYKHDRWPAKGGEPAYTQLYIECKDNQKFSIVVALSIDGRKAGVWAYQHFEATFETYRVSERINGVFYDRTLVFTPLKRSEDGPKIQGDKGKHLGTIELVVARGQFHFLRNDIPPTHLKEKETAIIDEKLKKGRLTSYIGQDDRVASKPRRIFQFIPKGGYPGYKIVFNYATRPALELLEVVSDQRAVPVSLRQGSSGSEARGSKRSRGKLAKDATTPDDEDDNADTVVPVAGPSKRRKIQVIELLSDSDAEDTVNKDDLVASLQEQVKLLRRQLSKKVKQERLDEGSTDGPGPSQQL